MYFSLHTALSREIAQQGTDCSYISCFPNRNHLASQQCTTLQSNNSQWLSVHFTPSPEPSRAEPRCSRCQLVLCRAGPPQSRASSNFNRSLITIMAEHTEPGPSRYKCGVRSRCRYRSVVLYHLHAFPYCLVKHTGTLCFSHTHTQTQ